MIAYTVPRNDTIAQPPAWLRQAAFDAPPAEIEAALDRMSVRVTAAAAHRESLNRAAQGIWTISGHLALLQRRKAGRSQCTETSLLAAAAIKAAYDEAESVLAADGAISVEEQRSRLSRALSQARNALFLLSE